MKTQRKNTGGSLCHLAAIAAVTSAVRVESQANVHEVASLIQEALLKNGAESELNANIGSSIQDQINQQGKEEANSKLGFLQKVVSLDCFFGSSNCLFKDKKSLELGQVTDIAKKKIEAANGNTKDIVNQVKQQVAVAPASHEKAKVVETKKVVDNKAKEADLKKQLKNSVQGLMQLDAKQTHKQAPAENKLQGNNNLAANNAATRSQMVKVPIDEVKAIGIQLQPTYALDDLQSATLKSFRKVIGYDTFNSILQKDRDEVKDPADYYNVTVSMMIKRNPNPNDAVTHGVWKNADGKTLSQVIDKGFPYDDGDIDVLERIKKVAPKAASDQVGKLNGMNVTKDNLKNLVVDKSQPLTDTFVLLSESGDKDNVFKLMDANVSKGQMKNLITDKPSPITVKLAQSGDDKSNVFKLMDSNVTKGQMKNLITDKPSPITVKLAQINGDKDNVFKLMDANVSKGQMKNLITDKPSPITVKLAQVLDDKSNVFKLMDSNVTKGQMKNLITDKPSPITVKLAQLQDDKSNVFKLMDSNVTKGQMKNLITDKPSPITVKLAQVPVVLEGVQLVQTEAQNPVWNPPFNNWSVNQPSGPHAHGLAGNADLGQHIIVDGHAVHFVQTGNQDLVQMNEIDNAPGQFGVVDADNRESVEIQLRN